MKAAIYIRVSTEEQANFGYSLMEQQKLGEEYCKEHDYTVVGVYADEGVSAAKSLTKRKALLRMVSDAEAGLINIIVFKDFTRWSRSGSAYYKIQDRLDKCGVGWISIQQPYLETLTPTGRFQVSIMLGMSQLEAEQTGERVKFIQEGRVQRGFYPFGGNAVPYGYRMQRDNGGVKLVPDPEESRIIKDVFAYFLTCANITQTGKHFGLKYTHTHHILENRIYIGEFRGIPDFCEPIIAKDDFEKAQKIKVHKSYKTYERGTYIFSSVGRCHCGGAISAHKMTNTKSRQAYYRCTWCRKGGISEPKLEEKILAEMDRYIGEAQIEAKAKQRDTASERKKLQSKLERLNDLYVDGNISKAKYKEKRSSLEAQISALEPMRTNPLLSFKGDWKDAYKLLNNERKNALWKTVLHHYQLNEDKTVTLFFN